MPTAEYKYALGSKLRDITCGYEGIAVTVDLHLNGCVRYGIKAPSVDGKMTETWSIDEQQLELVDEGITKKHEIIQNKTGGPAERHFDLPDGNSIKLEY
jgi:hypothetical protein